MPTLTVPFTYDAEAGGKPVRYLSTLDVNVPAIRGEHAPLALRVLSRGYTRYETNSGPKPAPERVLEYRVHEGDLLRPLPSDLSPYIQGFARDVTLKNVASKLASMRNKIYDYTTNSVTRYLCHDVLPGGTGLAMSGVLDGDAARTEPGNRAARAAEVTAEWVKARFVDGVLFVPSEGPGIVISSELRWREADSATIVTLLLAPEFRWLRAVRAQGKVFHYTKLEEAFSAAREEIRIAVKQTNHRPRMRGNAPRIWAMEPETRFEVLETGLPLPTADDRPTRLASAARRFVSDLQTSVGEASPAWIRQYVALRAALGREDAQGIARASAELSALALPPRAVGYRTAIFKEFVAASAAMDEVAIPGAKP